MKRKTKHTQAAKERMSQAKLGHSTSPETKAKISKALKGRTLTKVTRKKMSLAKKGIPKTPETRERIRQTLLLRYEIEKASGKQRRMSPERLKRHKQMLKKKKPWLSTGSKTALKESRFNRSQKKILTDFLAPPKDRKRSKNWSNPSK